MASPLRLVRPSLKNILNISALKMRCLPRNATRMYLVSCFNVSKSYNRNELSECRDLLKDKVKDPLNIIVSRYFSADAKLSVDKISEKVMNICKTFDKIPTDKVTLDSHFMTDLGLDSLDHVELIMNIEDEFNFEIPDTDAEKLLRPKDIVEYVLHREQTSTP